MNRLPPERRKTTTKGKGGGKRDRCQIVRNQDLETPCGKKKHQKKACEKKKV